MPAPADFPAINGYHYSYASIEITMLGEVTKYVAELSYDDAVERGLGRGTSGRKKIRTRPENSPEASITFYRREFDEFVARLKTAADRAGVAPRDFQFEMTVTYADNGQPTVTDTLQDCVIGGPSTNPSEGTDPTQIELPLDINKILWNGVDLDAVPS